MIKDLSAETEFRRIKCDGTNYTGAAGTSDLTSESIDTANFDDVTIVIGFGAITSGAVTSVKVQQCDTEGGSYADLEGTAQTIADDDDNQVVVMHIHRPRERYLKTVIDRGTANAVVDFELVLLSNGRVQPVTQGALVVGVERFNSPAEGTA